MNQRMFMNKLEHLSPPVEPIDIDDDELAQYDGMRHEREEQDSKGQSKEREKEYEKLEWIANPPLEHTTLVYSVPVRGEWKNGHVLRMLQAMLAQRVAPQQACEVSLVANLGYLSDQIADGDEAALRKQAETHQVIAFVKAVVEIQGLARERNGARTTKKKLEVQEQIDARIAQVHDVVARNILKQSAYRAEEISISLVDATPMVLNSIGRIRTLGIDALAARFEHNDQVVLSLFDGDTVPLDNRTVQEIQSLYAARPLLTYVFCSISDQAKGESKTQVSDTNISRHIRYNSHWGSGSPQISFRLRAYEKLNKIVNFFIIGDEDRDTAVRLGYHFNDLQDGLLFEASTIVKLQSSPRVLTAARSDGFVDGRGEAREGSRENILANIKDVWTWQREIIAKIEGLNSPQKELAARTLRIAREKELHREKVQQRMNRTVIRSLLTAHEKGWIHEDDSGRFSIDEENARSLPGATALQHYVRANTELIRSVLASSDDLECVRYYAGITTEVPKNIHNLTPFQFALREYLGEVKDLGEAPELKIFDEDSIPQSEPERTRTIANVVDDRENDSMLSFWHGMTAELLALAYVDRAFFQSKAFASYQYNKTQHWDKEKGRESYRERYLGENEEADLVSRISEMRALHKKNVRAIPVDTSTLSLMERISQMLPSMAVLSRLLRGRS